MKASIFNMTMNDQILRQQTEQTNKRNKEKAHKRVVDDHIQLEVTQQLSKNQKKRKNQRTLVSKRRKVAQALNKKQAKASKSAETRSLKKTGLNKTKNQQVKKGETTEAQKAKLPKEAFENLKPAAQEMIRQFGYRLIDRNLNFFEPELEDLDFIPNEEELPEEFQTKEGQEAQNTQTPKKAKGKKTKNTSSKTTKAHVKKLSPKDKKEYLTKILSGNGKDILETLLDPKYLVGCSLTDAELTALKQQVSKRARLIRRITMRSLPTAVDSVRRSGLGHELGSWGDQFPDLGGEEKHHESANAAIFEAMAESLALTGLLQKLGIQSDIAESRSQSTTATEELAEAKAAAKKNMDALHKNLHRSACQKLIKIFSYIAAFILIAIGQPEAGLLMLAAASGLLQMLIEKLASAMGMSELGIKALIMAITVIIAIISANPEIMGEDAISALSAFGNTMMVAGSIGFVQDFIGFCATGQTDESKFPSWVSWAALGINIAAMLPDLVVGGYQLISKGMSKAAAKAEAAASEAAASAEAAAASAKAAADVAEEGGVTGIKGAKAVAGEAESDVDNAARAIEKGADAAIGQALEDGADAAASASRVAKSTTRPVQQAAGDAESAATEALQDGEKASEKVASTSSKVGETQSSGAGQRATAAGASKANKMEEMAKEITGEEAQNSVAAVKGSASGEGAETYAAAEKEVSETLKEAKEGDPFKGKLRKAMDALKKAEADLDKLMALEERGASAAEETAGEAAAQFKKAQEEVERLQAEVNRLEEMVASQESAVAKFTRQFEDLKALHAEKLEKLEALEQNAAENADAIAQLKGEISEVEQKMSKLSEEVKNLDATQKALSEAEDKLSAAKERAIKWKERMNSDKGSEPKSKYAKMKAYLRTNFGKIGKVLLMADTLGQGYAEFKLAEIDKELGTLMAEVAEATGNFELLNTFYEIFGTLQSDTRQRNQQYAKDMHDEVKLVGDIINAERRASNALMSA